jgi:hypothetical protein
MERGIISYYATKTLTDVDRMDSWLQKIVEAIKIDLLDGHLTEFQAPSLQILGNAAAHVPGRSMAKHD